ncbi:MAG: GNAT family N-acetyltransferase [Spirochaetaceae bacterium]|jgi:phosphinothricin acetyltransferase|nr:GNAT family N-acetyltransferase [Spirochaetaceae bacterium]
MLSNNKAIRPVMHSDAASLCSLYNYYIEHTVITFEEDTVSLQAMEERIRTITARYPWLVWEDGGEVIGYASTNRWRERPAYRFSVENSLYLRHGFEGQGIGSCLLAALLDKLRQTDLHAVVAAITLPNERSTAVHEKFGFKMTARFNEIGFKQDRWLDVGYWELLL